MCTLCVWRDKDIVSYLAIFSQVVYKDGGAIPLGAKGLVGPMHTPVPGKGNTKYEVCGVFFSFPRASLCANISWKCADSVFYVFEANFCEGYFVRKFSSSVFQNLEGQNRLLKLDAFRSSGVKDRTIREEYFSLL